MSREGLMAEKRKENFRKDAKAKCKNNYKINFENFFDGDTEFENEFSDYTVLSQDAKQRHKDNEKASYKKINFFIDFNEIYSNFSQNMCETTEKNKLYCEKFAVYALQHYMTYVSMWSSIISDGKTNAFTPTNGTVEGCFHNIISKVDFGAGRLKYGRFVEALRESIRSETTQVLYQIPATNLNINKKTLNKSELDINSLSHKELWGHSEVLSPRTSGFANLFSYKKLLKIERK